MNRQCAQKNGHRAESPNHDAMTVHKSTHEGVEDMSYDTSHRDWSPERDATGETLYLYKHRVRTPHLFAEAVLRAPEDGPRYYLGIHDDAQPMTYEELTAFLLDVMTFYGEVAREHDRAEEIR
jgi:hypothetical protein